MFPTGTSTQALYMVRWRQDWVSTACGRGFLIADPARTAAGSKVHRPPSLAAPGSFPAAARSSTVRTVRPVMSATAAERMRSGGN